MGMIPITTRSVTLVTPGAGGLPMPRPARVPPEPDQTIGLPRITVTPAWITATGITRVSPTIVPTS